MQINRQMKNHLNRFSYLIKYSTHSGLKEKILAKKKKKEANCFNLVFTKPSILRMVVSDQYRLLSLLEITKATATNKTQKNKFQPQQNVENSSSQSKGEGCQIREKSERMSASAPFTKIQEATPPSVTSLGSWTL